MPHLPTRGTVHCIGGIPSPLVPATLATLRCWQGERGTVAVASVADRGVIKCTIALAIESRNLTPQNAVVLEPCFARPRRQLGLRQDRVLGIARTLNFKFAALN